MALTEANCVPCHGGISPLTREQAERYVKEVAGWKLDEKPTRVERCFSFPDFAAALAFVNKVGALAEAEGHHPDIDFGWGRARVTFYTHKIGGLHQNDFIMAAKVNALA